MMSCHGGPDLCLHRQLQRQPMSVHHPRHLDSQRPEMTRIGRLPLRDLQHQNVKISHLTNVTCFDIEAPSQRSLVNSGICMNQVLLCQCDDDDDEHDDICFGLDIVNDICCVYWHCYDWSPICLRRLRGPLPQGQVPKASHRRSVLSGRVRWL